MVLCPLALAPFTLSCTCNSNAQLIEIVFLACTTMWSCFHDKKIMYVCLKGRHSSRLNNKVTLDLMDALLL